MSLRTGEQFRYYVTLYYSYSRVSPPNISMDCDLGNETS
jgi:hypothetical protein